MGGLFKAPKPKIIPPPSARPVTSAQAPMALPQASAAADAAASEARIENRTSASRGVPGTGTITTSARGVLEAMPDFITTRRSLLGE